MERIGLVGLNWRLGGPEALARFTLPAETRGEAIARVAKSIDAEELVYIATCNRVEVAFVTRNGGKVSDYRRRVFEALVGRAPEPGEAERQMRAWAGEGAVEHLFLIATGLDSARLGETEIAGQVRDALDLARAGGLVHDRLGLLFEEALKLSKRLQHETTLGEGRTSLAEIALDRVRERVARETGRVALVGVSPMTERCARSLVDEGVPLLVVNRTESRAVALAQDLGHGTLTLPLEQFLSEPPALAAIVSATAAPGTVLGARELEACVRAAGESAAPLLVDFAVPPDIDPAATAALGLERIGMEEVIEIAEENRDRRVLEMGAARNLVDEAVMRLTRRLAMSSVERALRSLHGSYQETAQREVERLIKKRFSDLDEERAQVLRQFVGRLAKHFAHIPTTGLREIALRHGPEVIDGFFARAEAGLATDWIDGQERGEIFAALGDPDQEDSAE